MPNRKLGHVEDVIETGHIPLLIIGEAHYSSVLPCQPASQHAFLQARRGVSMHTRTAVIASGLAAAPPFATVALEIAASAVVRATPERLGVLRRDPGMTLPPAALRNADDQSVVSLAAVLKAMAAANKTPAECSPWGVIAAPRFLGRTALAAALRRFFAEGAWGVSPHLVPQQSQHAVGGLLSQMLGMRGPSFGVGGGPGSGAEAAQIAAALLQDEALPGLWLVFSAWDPEPVLNDRGQMPPDAQCQAAALALQPLRDATIGPRLCVCPGVVTAPMPLDTERTWFDAVEQFGDTLCASRMNSGDHEPETLATLMWPLFGCAWIELRAAGPTVCHDNGPPPRGAPPRDLKSASPRGRHEEHR